VYRYRHTDTQIHIRSTHHLVIEEFFDHEGHCKLEGQKEWEEDRKGREGKMNQHQKRWSAEELDELGIKKGAERETV
jgi:hypothetical protein